MGKQWLAVSTTQTIRLEEEEYLTGFIGRSGLIIDRLGLLTSHSNTLNVGGTGGFPFAFMGKQGYHVGAVSGSVHYS